MPETINWTLSVQVAGGPTISAIRSLSVDAYDVVNVVIPAGATEVEVAVQPGSADQVQFLLINSNQYGADLTYTLTSGGSEIALDAQLLLVGEGAVGLLGSAPETLFFSNGLPNDASIQILVGRRATV